LVHIGALKVVKITVHIGALKVVKITTLFESTQEKNAFSAFFSQKNSFHGFIFLIFKHL